jgi:peptidoglycan LD-endopeptidase CwlK
MTDKVSIDRINQLHPAIKDEVMALYLKAQALMPAGVTIRIVQGLRTFAEQHALYLQRPSVTKADAGQSYHNYGLAIDFCLMQDGKLIWEVNDSWMKVVKVFKDAGYEWGGEWKFKDNPHLQKVFGHNWRDLLDKHDHLKFLPGTEFITLS